MRGKENERIISSLSLSFRLILDFLNKEKIS